MTVDPHAAKHTASHAGRPYYFCSAGCRAKFMASPAKYLAPEQARAEPVPEGTIYTCPMHPQIRQVGPGSCPICGMALEPELVTADTGPNPELVDMTRRFWIGLALTLPVFALEMGAHLTNLHMLLGSQLSNWMQLVLATPVVLWAGWPFFVRGWASLGTRNLNMFTLIAMGTGVAWGYSIVATVFPGLFPAAFRGMTAPCPSTSRRPPSSRYWFCSVRCSSSRRASRPAVPFVPCSTLRPSTRVAWAPTATMRMSASRPWRGRPLARAARRERARRRRAPGRAEHDRRIDGHRRVDARRQGGRLPRHRRHHEPVRRLHHARRQGRPRHHAGADRADGGRGAEEPRAHSAAGRPGLRLVRSAGDRGRRCSPSWPGPSGDPSRASPSA